MSIELSIFTNPIDWATLEDSPNATALSAEEWGRLKPEAHLALHKGPVLVARCSVWRNSLPEWEGSLPAAIGHFEAMNIPAGKHLLAAVLEWLKEQSTASVIGPMDANTWNRYRLVTHSDGRPPFLMEPAHPEFYPAIWENAGFSPVAEYHSAEAPLSLGPDPRLDRTIERLKANGVTIRNLNPADYGAELRRIYAVACEAFATNFFYTDISEDDFIALYAPYREKLDPRLVFLAEQAGEVVGFLFGIPDFAQALRKEPVDTVILKTVAARQRRDLAGLGLWIVHQGHQRAAELGYQKMVHALVTGQSKLRNLGGDTLDVFREYTLFGRKI